MKKYFFLLSVLIFNLAINNLLLSSNAIIIEHNCCDLSKAPAGYVINTKDNIKIAYGHTSYGSRIISGMAKFQNDIYSNLFDDTEFYFTERVITGLSSVGNSDRTIRTVARRNLVNNTYNNTMMQYWNGNGLQSIEKPDILSPSDADIINNPELTLSWSIIADADIYDLQISIAQDFSSLRDDISTEFASYSIIGLDRGVKYYCRVRARNSEFTSFWSDIVYFVTELGMTELILPTDNQVIEETNVLLEWESVSNSDKYGLQASYFFDFSNILFEFDVNNNQYLLTGLGKGLRYYWRVMAKNSIATGPWSNSNNFLTELKSPKLSFPYDGKVFTGTEVSLEWKEVKNADEYETVLSDDVDFNNIITSKIGITTKYAPMNLKEGNTYFWRVKAMNTIIESPWSSTRKFSCESEREPELSIDVKSISFGDTESQSYKDMPFDINNIGNAILQINEISIESDTEDIFKIIETGFPYNIQQNNKQIFNIRFSPTKEIIYSAVVYIYSNAGDEVNFNISGKGISAVSVEEKTFVNSYVSIECSPNPFFGVLNIGLDLKTNTWEFVEVFVINSDGRLIADLLNKRIQPGYHNINYDFSKFVSGKYFVIVQVKGTKINIPVIQLK